MFKNYKAVNVCSSQMKLRTHANIKKKVGPLNALHQKAEAWLDSALQEEMHI